MVFNVTHELEGDAAVLSRLSYVDGRARFPDRRLVAGGVLGSGCCRGANPVGINLNDNYMTREIIHNEIPFNLRARGRMLLKAGKVIVIAVLLRRACKRP